MPAFRWACPNGSTTGSYQGPPATSGDEGLSLHFMGLVRSRNPAAVVRNGGGNSEVAARFRPLAKTPPLLAAEPYVTRGSHQLGSRRDEETVDLVSRDASAAGRHPIARCLTAHGSPFFSKISLNQQPPSPDGKLAPGEFHVVAARNTGRGPRPIQRGTSNLPNRQVHFSTPIADRHHQVLPKA
jgi:hypothetical protein